MKKGDFEMNECENEAQQRYRRAARLLASKLNMNWRELPPQQVLDYALKLDLAAKMRAEKNKRHAGQGA